MYDGRGIPASTSVREFVDGGENRYDLPVVVGYNFLCRPKAHLNWLAVRCLVNNSLSGNGGGCGQTRGVSEC